MLIDDNSIDALKHQFEMEDLSTSPVTERLLKIASSLPLGDFPRPVKIDKFLEQVEKVIEGFSNHYGVLSEFAHPNWAGTVSLYSKYHPENLTIEFGQNIRSGDQAKELGVNSLHAALKFFEVTYNNLTDSMPAFVELCQRHLREQKEKSEQAPSDDRQK